MTTGQFIKEQRLKKGMTQEELASKTDISARSIQRIENEEVDPRAYTLQTIATALEIDFEVLNKIHKPDFEEEEFGNPHIWLPLLHLSGLFTLLLPPLIIWFLKKDKVSEIRVHAINVINFQLTMLLYMGSRGILSILLFPIVIAIGLAIFSNAIIILNTIKAFNKQSARYPLAINFLKP